MITPNDILSILPQSKSEIVVYKQDNDTNDIIKGILLMNNAQIDNYILIAAYLCTHYDAEQIPEFLFNFCKTYFKYVEDSADYQDIKSPSFMLENLKLDCKGYSLFIGGILNGINNFYGFKYFDVYYSFVSYDETPEPSHVFILCNNEVIDPCLNNYNTFKECTFIYTYLISNNMKVKKSKIGGGSNFYKDSDMFPNEKAYYFWSDGRQYKTEPNGQTYKMVSPIYPLKNIFGFTADEDEQYYSNGEETMPGKEGLSPEMQHNEEHQLEEHQPEEHQPEEHQPEEHQQQEEQQPEEQQPEEHQQQEEQQPEERERGRRRREEEKATQEKKE